jgi:hypothetical protein
MQYRNFLFFWQTFRARCRASAAGPYPWRPQQEGAESGACWRERHTAPRLYTLPTIEWGSRPACQNATVIRSPASSQHSSKPLKTNCNLMSDARNTSKRCNAGCKCKSRPRGRQCIFWRLLLYDPKSRRPKKQVCATHSHIARRLCLTLSCSSIRLPSLPLCGYGN